MDNLHKLTRREFIGLLGLIGCSKEEVKPKMKARKIFASFLNSSFNYADYMDQLNLQSDSASYFTLSGSNVSQWNDLSGQDRHATQSNNTYRPLYNGGEILFDGTNDCLQLPAQFSISTFSFYAVVKSTDFANIQGIVGGNTTNYIGKNTGRQLALDNSGSGGGNIRYKLYGDEYYQVYSYRRTGATITIKVNGRTLIYISGALNPSSHNFRYIGSGAFGPTSIPWNGIIRSICISSQYLDDATDTKVVNALYSKYSLPETSGDIVGFGDSITDGTGASNSFSTAWLPSLASAKARGYKNFGISGSPCSNVASAANNGQDRWDIQLVERPYSDYVCILYGTNDISAGYTATNYKDALTEIVGGLITSGYSPNRIAIGTVPYRSADAFASTIAQYNTKIDEIISTYGICARAEVYANMKAYGDGCLLDSVHPNDIGHGIIKDAFNAVLP